MALYSSAIQIQSYESDNLIPSAAHVSGLACALHKLISVTNDVKKFNITNSKHKKISFYSKCFYSVFWQNSNVYAKLLKETTKVF